MTTRYRLTSTGAFDRGWLDWALSFRADDYVAAQQFGAATGPNQQLAAEWPWVMLAQRYAFHHGPGYALNRINMARRAAA